ncbi:MAG: aminotransferase class I/II-fold pyridoxal phosphate-dependent enzyme [Acidimicrobiales bacterium]
MTADRGYVGSALAELLLRHGYEVVGCDRGWFGRGSGGRFEDLTPADLTGFSVVFHLAAFPDRASCAAFPAEAADLNVSATVELARRCRAAGVGRFVHASSAAVYGRTVGPVDEAALPAPRDLFGETKRAAEAGVLALRSATFTPVALRFGSGFGLSPATRFDLLVNKLVHTGLVEGRLALGSDGEAARPFVGVDDMARAALFVATLDGDVPPVVNVVHPDGNRRVADVARLIGDRLGLPVELGTAGDDASYTMDPSLLISRGFEYRWALEPGIDRLARSIAYRPVRVLLGPERNRLIAGHTAGPSAPLVTPIGLDDGARAGYREAIDRLIRTGTYRVDGGWTGRAERLLATEVGAGDDQEVVMLRSGTDALVRGLQLCNVGPGSTVIVPDHAFHAVASSVLLLGARPLLVDIRPDDFTIDPDQVGRRLDEGGVDAVVGVDNYGSPCDWDGLAARCRAAGVPLVVDACESLGADIGGRKVAEVVDLVALSFSFTKPVHAAGMGGALIARREQVARLRADPRFLTRQTRLPEVNGAYLVEAWPQLEPNIARLRRIYDTYRRRLEPLGFEPQREHGRGTRIHAPFLVPADSPWSRDEFVAELVGRGIGAAAQFPSQAVLLELGEPQPVSARVHRSVVSLPSGAGLDPAVVEPLARAVARAYRSGPPDRRTRKSSGR